MLDDAAFLHLLITDERNALLPLKLSWASLIIPSGIFLVKFTAPPIHDVFHKGYSELDGMPFILFPGGLHYRKSRDIFADALEVVATNIPGVMRPVLDSDASAESDFTLRNAMADSDERVCIAEPIYGATKFQELVGATHFCLPSRQKKFSIAIIEALACEIPAVMSLASHFLDVVGVHAVNVVDVRTSSIAGAHCALLYDCSEAERPACVYAL